VSSWRRRDIDCNPAHRILRNNCASTSEAQEARNLQWNVKSCLKAMQEQEKRLREEVRRLLQQAEAIDVAKDIEYGPENMGDGH